MRSLHSSVHRPGSTITALEALAERESIYRVLAQTTPENTSKDYASYTCDPHTRYPTLNTKLVSPVQVAHLLDTDNPSQLEEDLRTVMAKHRNDGSSISSKTSSNSTSNNMTGEGPEGKRPRRDGINGRDVRPDALLAWLSKQVEPYSEVGVKPVLDMTTSFQDGLAFAAIVHRYRPDLIDFYSLTLLSQSPENSNNGSAVIIQNVFDTLESELGILPVMSGRELADTTRKPDKLTMMSYLSQIYELFRREIPAAIGMGDNDPFSVTTRFSDDGLLDRQNEYDVAKKRYQKRGNCPKNHILRLNYIL